MVTVVDLIPICFKEYNQLKKKQHYIWKKYFKKKSQIKGNTFINCNINSYIPPWPKKEWGTFS